MSAITENFWFLSIKNSKLPALSVEEFEKIKSSIQNALSGQTLTSFVLFEKLNGINKEKARSVLNFLQAEQKVFIIDKGEISIPQ